MLLKKIFIIVLFVTVTISLQDVDKVQASAQKIGVMDVQKVLAMSDAGKSAKVTIDLKMKQLQGDLSKDEEKLIALKLEIEKKSSVWNDKMKEEKIRDFQKKQRELQTKSEEASFEMKQLQENALGPILMTLQNVLQTYGADNGYSMVLDNKAGIIFLDPALDISEDLIKELNKRMNK